MFNYLGWVRANSLCVCCSRLALSRALLSVQTLTPAQMQYICAARLPSRSSFPSLFLRCLRPRPFAFPECLAHTILSSHYTCHPHAAKLHGAETEMQLPWKYISSPMTKHEIMMVHIATHGQSNMLGDLESVFFNITIWFKGATCSQRNQIGLLISKVFKQKPKWPLFKSFLNNFYWCWMISGSLVGWGLLLLLVFFPPSALTLCAPVVASLNRK